MQIKFRLKIAVNGIFRIKVVLCGHNKSESRSGFG